MRRSTPWQALLGVLLAALLLASGPARAQADPATAEALMRSSGLWAGLASIAPQVRQGLEMAAREAGASDAEIERLARIADTAYAPERLRATALAQVVQGLQSAHLEALTRWYDSELGRRISRLEEAAGADTTPLPLLMQQGAALLQAAAPARREALDAITEATDAAEAFLQLTVGTALAVQAGARSVTPGAPGPSAAELAAALDAQRPQMLQNFTALALASFARSYASLSTEELAAYADFLRTPAGRHFNGVGLRAFGAAMSDGGTELGRRLPGSKDAAHT